MKKRSRRVEVSRRQLSGVIGPRRVVCPRLKVAARCCTAGASLALRAVEKPELMNLIGTF